MDRLKGKIALISGGARGQGAAEARIFVREGAKVVIGDVLDRESAALAEEINRKAGSKAAVAVHLDVTRAADWRSAIETADRDFGGLDILINNAGILNFNRIEDTSEEEWDSVVAVNQKGVWLGMKTAVPAIRKRGGGAIVNIGSGNEHAAAPGCAAYIAAKRGLLGLTAVAALEYGEQNIRVNAVGPGVMRTPAMHQTVEEHPRHIEFLKSLSPMNRFADPHEVAETAVFLCTDKASFVTGHTLAADGGASAGKVFKNVV